MVGIRVIVNRYSTSRPSGRGVQAEVGRAQRN